MIEISISASGFLYHQIRCIVSIMVMVGRGFESPQVFDNRLVFRLEYIRIHFLNRESLQFSLDMYVVFNPT